MQLCIAPVFHPAPRPTTPHSHTQPRWGRNIECAGEDPLLSGQYAINFVQGFEHARETPYPLQASACCKHFVANELEGWNGTDRHQFDAIVPQQDLVDSYLPPFQACVEEGKVSGIMCSYNAVNGVPSCANNWLLTTLLRDSWGFDGYVTSDCQGDVDVFFNHHFTNSTNAAVAAIMHSGQDIECPQSDMFFLGRFAPWALGNGSITLDDVDTALRRLFRVRLRLGHFDPPGALQTIGPGQICTPFGEELRREVGLWRWGEIRGIPLARPTGAPLQWRQRPSRTLPLASHVHAHAAVELARDGARQSLVLLKNSNATLPLAAPSTYATTVVIGPNEGLNDVTGYYGGEPCFHNNTTPLAALQQWLPRATGIKGVPSVNSGDTSGIPAAASAAAAADLVILAIGSDLVLERETLDRTSIDLSPAQLALVSAVAAAARGPVVALVFGGGGIDVSPLLSNPKVGAVFWVGQPSVQIAAVGDLLFGRTLDGRQYSPAGRMSQTIYPAAFVNQVRWGAVGRDMHTAARRRVRRDVRFIAGPARFLTP